jgi:D-glycero-D-manno-heptose 1,7-bisphosphate phosphatase
MDTLNAIHEKMHKTVAAAGGRIEAIFYCPHAADAECDCRKPRSGMFQRIAGVYNTDLKGVPAIGDSLRDLQAATRAGASPILVLTGKGEKTQQDGDLPYATQVFPDLAAAADHILESGEK